MPVALPSTALPAKPTWTGGSSRASSCRPLKAFVSHPSGVGNTGIRTASDELGVVVASPVMGSRPSAGSMEITPLRLPGTPFTVSVFQHMGDRRTQEDRFTVVPQLEPDMHVPCAFFGVFDGTVGDFASENVKDLVVPKLLESPSWRLVRHAGRPAEQENLIESAVFDMYRTVDEALLARCARHNQHYATCTSATLLVVGDILAIGHLGDSRIVIGKDDESSRDASKPLLIGEQVTMDHKPDLEPERQRIEQCGGMVERLQNHSNKPFIRGGDFMMRKALGEQPMQLQYSRAFGAKDLKMFGLSNVPDVKLIRLGSPSYRRVRFAIIASDGLWDVVSSQQAVLLAQQAALANQNPAEALVRHALLEQSRRKARADNITAICVQFD